MPKLRTSIEKSKGAVGDPLPTAPFLLHLRSPSPERRGGQGVRTTPPSASHHHPPAAPCESGTAHHAVNARPRAHQHGILPEPTAHQPVEQPCPKGPALVSLSDTSVRLPDQRRSASTQCGKTNVPRC